MAPVRDVLTLDQLNDEERWDLASMYSHLLKRGNAFFDKGDGKGMDLPYIAAWHQAPVHDKRRENYRLNLQFFSFRRAANKIKYLAGLRIRHGRLDLRHHAGTHRQALPRARSIDIAD